MKLGIKIFGGIMISFSIIILIGGYVLLSFFYSTTMDREIQAAREQYQYNKFVLQSEMLTEKFIGNEGGSNRSGFGGETAVFSGDFSQLYYGFDKQADFVPLLKEAKKNEIHYKFQKIGNRSHLLMFGIVEEKDNRVYLVTAVDVENVLELCQQMKEKVLWVYLIAIALGICLSIGLSVLFTRPVRTLMVATERIADGKYGEQIVLHRRDEIGQLAGNFNRMSQAIQEKVGELSEAARQREDFVANFAHELKTPLTSIIGYADRIYQKDLSEEEQKQAAWYIWNEGMRLEALSGKLMDMTLLQHQDFLLETVRTDTLFGELAKDVRYLLTEHGISLSLDIEQADVKIECDLFKSLFYNLLDNAIKANAKNILVKAYYIQERAYYQIEIHDDGNGIPPQEIKRITEAFYMVDKSRSRKMHGAGLGLALSQRIAEIHGGTLEFQSDGKQGTMVRFALPCGGDASINVKGINAIAYSVNDDICRDGYVGRDHCRPDLHFAPSHSGRPVSLVSLFCKNKYINRQFLGICFLSFAVIVGGWFLMNQMLARKEGHILGQSGKIITQSAETEKNNKNTDSGVENVGRSFQGCKLSEQERIQILKIWETGKKEVPHEPLVGQMNMEQAVAEGRKWIESLAQKELLFSSALIQNFDKTSAKLCSFADETEIEQEKISFWEICYQNTEMQIILKIHALSGEVWSAEISMEQKQALRSDSDGEVLEAAFPSFRLKSSRLFRKDPICYMQNETGKLYFMLEKSYQKINSRPELLCYKLWVGTEAKKR